MDLRVKASVLTVLEISPSYRRARFAIRGENHDARNLIRDIQNKTLASSYRKWSHKIMNMSQFILFNNICISPAEFWFWLECNWDAVKEAYMDRSCSKTLKWDWIQEILRRRVSQNSSTAMWKTDVHLFSLGDQLLSSPHEWCWCWITRFLFLL